MNQFQKTLLELPSADAPPQTLSDDREQVRQAVDKLIGESAVFAAGSELEAPGPELFETPRVRFNFD